MSDSIFLIRPDHHLVEAVATPYALEKELQELLAEHVQLIPGAQIDRADPPRWQLVKREAGVPLEEGGSGWWAVDHLLVDQNAVPTFVEVKRSKDTRIRREVVAQMLEYAANGTVYWKPGTLRTWYEDAAGGAELGATKLAEWLQRQEEVAHAVADEFWNRVDANLQQGRVRCIFVADEIPATLQRLVEFLNEQLRLVDVLAVEVRQYQAEGTKALVPRVIGATAAAAANKGPSATTSLNKAAWDSDAVIENIRGRVPDVAWIPERIVDWARLKEGEGVSIAGGHGAEYPSLSISFDTQRLKGPRVRTMLVITGGPGEYAMLEVRLRRLRTTGPFHKGERRHEFLDGLKGLDIPRLNHALKAGENQPSVPMNQISDSQLTQLLMLLDQWCADARKYKPSDQPADVAEDEGA